MLRKLGPGWRWFALQIVAASLLTWFVLAKCNRSLALYIVLIGWSLFFVVHYFLRLRARKIEHDVGAILLEFAGATIALGAVTNFVVSAEIQPWMERQPLPSIAFFRNGDLARATGVAVEQILARFLSEARHLTEQERHCLERYAAAAANAWEDTTKMRPPPPWATSLLEVHLGKFVLEPETEALTESEWRSFLATIGPDPAILQGGTWTDLHTALRTTFSVALFESVKKSPDRKAEVALNWRAMSELVTRINANVTLSQQTDASIQRLQNDLLTRSTSPTNAAFDQKPGASLLAFPAFANAPLYPRVLGRRLVAWVEAQSRSANVPLANAARLWLRNPSPEAAADVVSKAMDGMAPGAPESYPLIMCMLALEGALPENFVNASPVQRHLSTFRTTSRHWLPGILDLAAPPQAPMGVRVPALVDRQGIATAIASDKNAPEPVRLMALDWLMQNGPWDENGMYAPIVRELLSQFWDACSDRPFLRRRLLQGGDAAWLGRDSRTLDDRWNELDAAHVRGPDAATPLPSSYRPVIVAPPPTRPAQPSRFQASHFEALESHGAFAAIANEVHGQAIAASRSGQLHDAIRLHTSSADSFLAVRDRLRAKQVLHEASKLADGMQGDPKVVLWSRLLSLSLEIEDWATALEAAIALQRASAGSSHAPLEQVVAAAEKVDSREAARAREAALTMLGKGERKLAAARATRVRMEHVAPVKFDAQSHPLVSEAMRSGNIARALTEADAVVAAALAGKGAPESAVALMDVLRKWLVEREPARDPRPAVVTIHYDSSLHRRLALCWANAGEFERARAIVGRALHEAILSDDPEDRWDATVDLAHVHHALGESVDAIAVLGELVESKTLGRLSPKLIQALEQIASWQSHMLDWMGARVTLQRALECTRRVACTSVTHEGILRSLYEVVARTGDHREALEVLREELRIRTLRGSSCVRTWEAMATHYGALGMHEAARGCIQKLLRSPEFADSPLARGVALEEMAELERTAGNPLRADELMQEARAAYRARNVDWMLQIGRW